MKDRISAELLESDEYWQQHAYWLKSADFRCALLPWKRLGAQDWKFMTSDMQRAPLQCDRPYYDTITGETGHGWIYEVLVLHEGSPTEMRLSQDVLILSPEGYWLITVALGGAPHGIAQPAPFPNWQQRLAIAWCKLPVWAKTKAIPWAIALYGLRLFILWSTS